MALLLCVSGWDSPARRSPAPAPFSKLWVMEAKPTGLGTDWKPLWWRIRTQMAKTDGLHQRLRAPSLWFSWLNKHPLITLPTSDRMQETLAKDFIFGSLWAPRASHALYSLCVDYKSIPLAFNIVFGRLLCNVKPVKFQFPSYFLFTLKNNQRDLHWIEKCIKLV